VGVLALGAAGALGGACKVGAEVQCPGSGNACAGDQCCPGYANSGGATFPCPSASSGFSGCVNNTKVTNCLSSSLRGSLAQPPTVLRAALDQTDITAKLNDNLQNYDRGVVVRTPDFIKTDGPKPAALLRSDIYPPNQFYMLGDEIVPFGQWPLVGYAVDDDKWDDVILNTYYPHDANSCDAVQPGDTVAYGRCGWTGENWECPGAWVADDTVSIQYDTNAVGASNYACRGCHFDQKSADATPMDWNVNQDFSVVDISTGFCNCPGADVIDYNNQDSVCDWVQQNLFETGKMINPTWWADPITCWVDNPVALSHLQNCYYWKYYASIGNIDSAMTEWWGWNEIGTNAIIDDPGSWQAILIFLPAQLHEQGLGDLSSEKQQYVETTLLGMADHSQPGGPKLLLGKGFITSRPGSYVVMANEWPDENSNWNHYFFCQSWTWDKLQVCFKAQDDDPDNKGYCYLEWASESCL